MMSKLFWIQNIPLGEHINKLYPETLTVKILYLVQLPKLIQDTNTQELHPSRSPLPEPLHFYLQTIRQNCVANLYLLFEGL